tara:strand:+ start:7460 stop:8125 length:666 start_codon:yes stop_codon:yes gene_type:complete
VNLEELQDSRKGEDCYILACGPSLNKYKDEETRAKLNSNLVFSVKQAYDQFKDETNFHFWNCSNLPIDYMNIPYRYADHRPEVVVASSNYEEGQRWNLEQDRDVFFRIPLVEQIGGKENTLAVKRNYDDYLISKTCTERRTGPGIMLETVFYTAIHVGVKSITTIGWDLNAHGSHFYNEKDKALMDNKGCEIPWDMTVNAQAVPSIKDWLAKKGIELNILQ